MRQPKETQEKQNRQLKYMKLEENIKKRKDNRRQITVKVNQMHLDIENFHVVTQIIKLTYPTTLISYLHSNENKEDNSRTDQNPNQRKLITYINQVKQNINK